MTLVTGPDLLLFTHPDLPLAPSILHIKYEIICPQPSINIYSLTSRGHPPATHTPPHHLPPSVPPPLISIIMLHVTVLSSLSCGHCSGPVLPWGRGKCHDLGDDQDQFQRDSCVVAPSPARHNPVMIMQQVHTRAWNEGSRRFREVLQSQRGPLLDI